MCKHYLITDAPSNKIVFTLFDLGFDNKDITIYFMEPYSKDMIQLKH